MERATGQPWPTNYPPPLLRECPGPKKRVTALLHMGSEGPPPPLRTTGGGAQALPGDVGRGRPSAVGLAPQAAMRSSGRGTSPAPPPPLRAGIRGTGLRESQGRGGGVATARRAMVGLSRGAAPARAIGGGRANRAVVGRGQGARRGMLLPLGPSSGGAPSQRGGGSMAGRPTRTLGVFSVGPSGAPRLLGPAKRAGARAAAFVGCATNPEVQQRPGPE